jgi:hypothetical protein
MGFIGGELRESFIGRIKGADPGQLWAVPIDVGKSSAALVCDFWGEIVAPPFFFVLNERGFQEFAGVLARAEAERDAEWVRVGLEQAGHYHRPLQARLETHGLAVTLFNLAQVNANRNQDLLRSLKSDAIDFAARRNCSSGARVVCRALVTRRSPSRPRSQRIDPARSRRAPLSRTRSTPAWTSCSHPVRRTAPLVRRGRAHPRPSICARLARVRRTFWAWWLEACRHCRSAGVHRVVRLAPSPRHRSAHHRLTSCRGGSPARLHILECDETAIIRRCSSEVALGVDDR